MASSWTVDGCFSVPTLRFVRCCHRRHDDDEGGRKPLAFLDSTAIDISNGYLAIILAFNLPIDTSMPPPVMDGCGLEARGWRNDEVMNEAEEQRPKNKEIKEVGSAYLTGHKEALKPIPVSPVCSCPPVLSALCFLLACAPQGAAQPSQAEKDAFTQNPDSY